MAHTPYNTARVRPDCRGPARDHAGSAGVGIRSMATRFAGELVPWLAGGLLDVAAHAARARGIAQRDEANRNVRLLSLQRCSVGLLAWSAVVFGLSQRRARSRAEAWRARTRGQVERPSRATAPNTQECRTRRCERSAALGALGRNDDPPGDRVLRGGPELHLHVPLYAGLPTSFILETPAPELRLLPAPKDGASTQETR